MDSSQPLVDMLTQDSEADLEVLTQAPIPDSGSSRGRGGNYNHNEDIQLCWSWMAITFDPRIGSDQPKGTYWNRIAQHYHENKTFVSDRNVTSLEKKVEWHPKGMHLVSRMHQEDRTSPYKWRSPYIICKFVNL